MPTKPEDGMEDTEYMKEYTNVLYSVRMCKAMSAVDAKGHTPSSRRTLPRMNTG